MVHEIWCTYCRKYLEPKDSKSKARELLYDHLRQAHRASAAAATLESRMANYRRSSE